MIGRADVPSPDPDRARRPVSRRPPEADRSPWTVLGTRRIYENPWIRIEEDRVVNPSGGPGIYGRVCFANLAVGIIPVDDDGGTWLVGQWRHPLERWSWEIPMGGVPLAEDPEAGARRELAEETGLSARHLERIAEVDLSNCVSDERGVVFVATGLEAGEPRPDDTEQLTAWQLPLADAIAMARRGEIRDALSVVGLLALAGRAHAD